MFSSATAGYALRAGLLRWRCYEVRCYEWRGGRRAGAFMAVRALATKRICRLIDINRLIFFILAARSGIEDCFAGRA